MTSEGAAAERAEMADTLKVAWMLVYLARAHMSSLEDRATAILAIIVGGMVAIWATAKDFAPGASRGLDYAALAVVIVSIFVAGTWLLPRRNHALARARALSPGLLFGSGDAMQLREEVDLATWLSTRIEDETNRLRHCIHVAVGLNLLALALVASAYLVEKI